MLTNELSSTCWVWLLHLFTPDTFTSNILSRLIRCRSVIFTFLFLSSPRRLFNLSPIQYEELVSLDRQATFHSIQSVEYEC